MQRRLPKPPDMPLVVMGCKNAEKDAELFSKVSEALQGKNILVLSAREENYKSVGASAGMAYNQKVGAESAVDINLAKQLNVLISQLGVPASSVVMNVGSAAAGYGYEYVASTLDRVKAAALAQSDAQLQMPIITPGFHGNLGRQGSRHVRSRNAGMGQPRRARRGNGNHHRRRQFSIRFQRGHHAPPRRSCHGCQVH